MRQKLLHKISVTRLFVVRRIRKNQIITCVITFKKTADIRLDHTAVRQTQRFKVFLNHLVCLTTVINHHCRRSSPTEGLETESPAARVGAQRFAGRSEGYISATHP